MTGYRVDLSKTAEKLTKKLDKPLQKAADALFVRIGTLADPRSVGHALHGVLTDYWTYTIHARLAGHCHDS